MPLNKRFSNKNLFTKVAILTVFVNLVAFFPILPAQSALAPTAKPVSLGKFENFSRRSGLEFKTNSKISKIVASSTKVSLLQKLESINKTVQSKVATDITNLKNKRLKATDAASFKQNYTNLKLVNDKLKITFETEYNKLSATDKEGIESAEPNYLFGQDDVYVPNDLQLDKQWYMRSILGQKVNTFSSVASINRPVVVAVIDSGIDYKHEDLKGAMWNSALCLDASGANIASGCSNGYDFVDNDVDPYPTDGSSHGTAVASLIGALTDNGKGIASLAGNRTKISIYSPFPKTLEKT